MDNRGVAPSSSPPAPYRIADMAADVLGVLDALGLERAVVAGHSLGGWIAETLAVTHAERLRGAVLMGSANESTSYERASLALAREIAASGLELPAAYSAIETLHYLPQRQLGDDDVVDFWLELLNGAEWANPGKLGQLDAALEWVGASSRRAQWETIAVPCLVLAFEFDIDSPPGRAAEAAAAMPGARFVCLEGRGTSVRSPTPPRSPTCWSGSCPRSRPDYQSAQPVGVTEPVMSRGSTASCVSPAR